MSETTTIVLKIISAIASIQAAFRFIIVASFIVLSWLLISKPLTDNEMPISLVLTVVLLSGVGVGSIISHFILAKYNSWAKKNKNDKQRTLDVEKKKNENSDFVLHFEEVLKHVDSEQRSFLRKLTSDDIAQDINYIDLGELRRSKFILDVSSIAKHILLLKLNPLLIEIVKEDWVNEIKNNVDDYFCDMTPEKTKILELMLERETDDVSVINFDIIEILSSYGSCFGVELDPPKDGLWIYFSDYCIDEFSKQTGDKYQEEVLILNKRIMSVDVKVS